MAAKQEYAYCEVLKAKIDEMRPFPPETLQSLKEYYRVGLTYSSNALEGNSLTESETKIVIEDGLTVDGKPILHAYEAIGHAEAYDHLYEISKDKPLELADILKLHELFYRRISPEVAGKIRTGQVFLSGSRYRLPKPADLPKLLNEFVVWFNASEKHLHPVEFAALVHQKFVFIHPFADGNGRMGRLWQSLILGQLNPVFEHLPVENMVYANQQGYYQAINQSSAASNCGIFIDFMLNEILQTLKQHQSADDVGVNVGVNVGVKILEYIKNNPGCRANAIAEAVGTTTRTVERHIRALKERGMVEFRGVPKTGGYFVPRQ